MVLGETNFFAVFGAIHKQRIRLEKESRILWKWAWQTSDFGNLVRDGLMLKGVQIHGGIDDMIGRRQWNLNDLSSEFSSLKRRLFLVFLIREESKIWLCTEISGN